MDEAIRDYIKANLQISISMEDDFSHKKIVVALYLEEEEISRSEIKEDEINYIIGRTEL
jgi:hypothetical protein